MKRHSTLRPAALFVAGCLLAVLAQAQTIKLSPDVFIDTPALPLAPPAAARAPVSSIAIAKPESAGSGIELVKGKRVDEQLRSYGKLSGWSLIWQAPEYVLDQNMQIQGDFETSILKFLQGANVAGSRLRAVFYRGNKMVRVTEF